MQVDLVLAQETLSSAFLFVGAQDPYTEKYSHRKTTRNHAKYRIDQQQGRAGCPQD